MLGSVPGADCGSHGLPDDGPFNVSVEWKKAGLFRLSWLSINLSALPENQRLWTDLIDMQCLQDTYYKQK